MEFFSGIDAGYCAWERQAEAWRQGGSPALQGMASGDARGVVMVASGDARGAVMASGYGDKRP